MTKDASQDAISAVLDDVAATLACLDGDDAAAISDLANRLALLTGEIEAPAQREMVARAGKKLRKVADGTAKVPSESLAAARRLVAAATGCPALEGEVSGTVEAEVDDAGAWEPNPGSATEPESFDGAPNSSTSSEAPSVSTTGDTAVVETPADALDNDPELVHEFVSEAHEYLTAAERALLVLEATPDDRPAIDTVFRAFHTVKGVAAVLGFSQIAELAHRAESLLIPVREGKARFGTGYANLALRAVDMIRSLVERAGVMAQGVPLSIPGGYAPLMAALDAPVGPDEAPTPGARVDPNEHEPVEKAPAPADAPPGAASTAETWVRVRTDRLDQLMDIVGELVIAQAMLSSDGLLASEHGRELSRKVALAGKTVRELHDLSLALRMVPLRGTFQKMARVVRDTARRVGRHVEFTTDGEETEIDRKLVDALADPLVHMVRNAVDHGIEPADDRVASGKPAGGTVRMRAYHAGGNVMVELSDDGRGLDKDKLVARAIEKGLVEPGATLSEQEAFQLIFEPGFSTAKTVTDVSGRGVGMDVVRRAIESLSGRVDIASTPGRGTTFMVRIPLTLAITDGMLVRVGAERYIVPTANIRITLRPDASSLKTVSGRGELVVLRGEAIPMFRLGRVFGVPGAVDDPTQGLVVIVGEEHSCSALLVDDLLGKQQVVTKSLGGFIGRVPGVSGGAILGDGRVGLIVDPDALIALARQAA
ncbi:MAG: chemotaxis protein CheA [Myxococcales bacterium]|nr:chemotaxis protein CheA [Myxococcales bacterium]